MHHKCLARYISYLHRIPGFRLPPPTTPPSLNPMRLNNVSPFPPIVVRNVDSGIVRQNCAVMRNRFGETSGDAPGFRSCCGGRNRGLCIVSPSPNIPSILNRLNGILALRNNLGEKKGKYICVTAHDAARNSLFPSGFRVVQVIRFLKSIPFLHSFESYFILFR